MNEFFEQVKNIFSFDHQTLARIGLTLVILIIALVLRSVLLAIFLKRFDKPKARFIIRRAISSGVFIVSLLILIALWSEGLSGLPTYLGLLSAGLAIALKDPIANFIAWLYIITSRLFAVGDRIQIGNDVGDVIDIKVFRIVALEVGSWVEADQTTGRIIYIPNARVFTETFRNYHAGFSFVWHEIGVTITFESNWQKAKNLIQDILNRLEGNTVNEAEKSIQEASKQFYINQRNFSPVVYTKLKEHGILLTMRYLCEPRRRRQSENDVVEEVLRTFAQNPDIAIAYPTRKVFTQSVSHDSPSS